MKTLEELGSSNSSTPFVGLRARERGSIVAQRTMAATNVMDHVAAVGGDLRTIGLRASSLNVGCWVLLLPGVTPLIIQWVIRLSFLPHTRNLPLTFICLMPNF